MEINNQLEKNHKNAIVVKVTSNARLKSGSKTEGVKPHIVAEKKRNIILYSI